MSTPTSRRTFRPASLVAAGLVAGLLGGCVDGLAGIGGLIGGGDTGIRSVAVTSDNVSVAGPRGFCVEPSSTRNDGDTGFALLGNCAAITGNARAPQPDVPALLTAAVSAPSDGASLTEDFEGLAVFFRSEPGRRLLSRSGDPANVEILDIRASEGMVLLHARDTSPAALPGVAQDYWRAYMDIGPRLATLSVLALADRDVGDEAALRLLNRFAAAMRAANAAGSGAPAAAELPQGGREAGGGLFRGGLFRGIFR